MHMPTFYGDEDTQSVNFFLRRLEKYKRVMCYDDMLESVLSSAFLAGAELWWEKHQRSGGFQTWPDLKLAFRRRYLPSDYAAKLRRQTEDSIQTESETLLAFLYTIVELYERLDPDTPTSVRIDRFLANVRPEFSPFLQAKFSDWTQVEEAAIQAQARVDRSRERPVLRWTLLSPTWRLLFRRMLVQTRPR